MNDWDGDAVPMTRQERREQRRNNGQKMRVSGRSVHLLRDLAGRPLDSREKMVRRQKRRRKEGS